MLLILKQKFPLLKCLPLSYFYLTLQALSHLFQSGASCTWTTGPKEHDYAFRPCKEWHTICVCVCVVNHSAFTEGKKERGREKGALTCKSLLLLYLPPTHIVHSNTDMGCNKEDTQVNSTELSQWVQLTHPQRAHTHTLSRVLSE